VIDPPEGAFDLGGEDNLVDSITGIITRHPMKESELVETLTKWSPGEISETLAALEASGKAQIVLRYGIRFWSASPSYYPDTK
jgi:hypothetical protein